MRYALPLATLVLAAPLFAAEPLDATKGQAYTLEKGLAVTVATMRPPFKALGGRQVGVVFTNTSKDSALDLSDWRYRLRSAGLSNDQDKAAANLNAYFVPSQGSDEIKPPTIYPGKSATAWVWFESLPPGKEDLFFFELPGPRKTVIRFSLPGTLAPPR